MLSSKDRAYLRKIVASQSSILQIGKDALSESNLNGILLALQAREIVKINVLQNCDQSAKELANELAEKLECEVVGVIGRKVIVYKFNPTNKAHVLEKDWWSLFLFIS